MPKYSHKVPTMEILAVDLGKVKSVVCNCQCHAGKYEFETVGTEPAILEDLFRRRRPDRVVITVGPAAGWMTDLAARIDTAPFESRKTRASSTTDLK